MSSDTRGRAEKYQDFFYNKLLPKLRKERPMWDWEIHNDHQNWVNLQSINLDLWMGVGFTEESKLRIDLHIGGRILERYSRLYPEMYERKSLIEEALGLTLMFTAPGAGNAPAARIEIERDDLTTIEDAEKSNDILDWTVLNVISFRSAFASHIRELLS